MEPNEPPLDPPLTLLHLQYRLRVNNIIFMHYFICFSPTHYVYCEMVHLCNSGSKLSS